MMPLRTRPGFSLLETMLFLGILSIMSTTIVAVYIATQEARIRQRAVAELEQAGTQIVETMTKNIRRAEKILDPATNSTGGILTLQMADNGEFPTILAASASGNIVIVQKTSSASLLTSRVHVSSLVFRNVNDTNVSYAFDLTIVIPTIVPQPYTRTFAATTTLFPDDQSEAGGCGSCAAPVCSDGQYIWQHCDSGTCGNSNISIPC